MAYLINKVEALEKALLEKNETPTTPVDRWLNIDELKAYLPDHPAKATIYGWEANEKSLITKEARNYVFVNLILMLGYPVENVEAKMN